MPTMPEIKCYCYRCVKMRTMGHVKHLKGRTHLYKCPKCGEHFKLYVDKDRDNESDGKNE